MNTGNLHSTHTTDEISRLVEFVAGRKTLRLTTLTAWLKTITGQITDDVPDMFLHQNSQSNSQAITHGAVNGGILFKGVCSSALFFKHAGVGRKMIEEPGHYYFSDRYSENDDRPTESNLFKGLIVRKDVVIQRLVYATFDRTTGPGAAELTVKIVDGCPEIELTIDSISVGVPPIKLRTYPARYVVIINGNSYKCSVNEGDDVFTPSNAEKAALFWWSLPRELSDFVRSAMMQIATLQTTIWGAVEQDFPVYKHV